MAYVSSAHAHELLDILRSEDRLPTPEEFARFIEEIISNNNSILADA